MMGCRSKSVTAGWILLSGVLLGQVGLASEDDTATEQVRPSAEPLPSVSEARGRARLLHETLRGTLQVMHRDFFDEDNAHAIPSASLEDVFDALGEDFGVKIKWLNVETDVVNIDHEPEDEFERNAAKALVRGKAFHESTTQVSSSDEQAGRGDEQAGRGDRASYRFVGPIRLRSQCLKCHVKRRVDNRDRVAGLSISMWVQTP